MDSNVHQDIRMYLIQHLKRDAYDCGTVIDRMTQLARSAGHDLDHRFAGASLSVGPEGRIASQLLSRATGGAGIEASEYDIKEKVDEWCRRYRRIGK